MSAAPCEDPAAIGAALAAGEVRRVLVVRAARLGDTLHVRPALELLEAALPAARRVFLCSAYAAPVARGAAASEVVPWAHKGRGVAARRARARTEARLAASGRFDLALGLEDKPWARALAARLGCRFWHARSSAGAHVVERKAGVLAPLGLWAPEHAPPPIHWAPLPWALAAARPLLAPLPRPWIGLQAGSHAGRGLLPERRRRDPQPEWLVRAGAALASELGGSVVLHAGLGGQEARVARATARGLRAAGVPTALATGLDLERLGGLLALLDLVVSANTGPAHLAAASGVPLVLLEGPSTSAARPWRAPRVALVNQGCPAAHVAARRTGARAASRAAWTRSRPTRSWTQRAACSLGRELAGPGPIRMPVAQRQPAQTRGLTFTKRAEQGVSTGNREQEQGTTAADNRPASRSQLRLIFPVPVSCSPRRRAAERTDSAQVDDGRREEGRAGFLGLAPRLGGRSFRICAVKGQISFLFPFFRPYAARYLLLIVFTIGAAASEGGQAYLLEPLLNRVLLRGTDSASEHEDTDWLAKQASKHPQAVADARRRAALQLAAPPAPDEPTRPAQLLVFAGRSASPDLVGDAQEREKDESLLSLLERTRLVLLDVGRTLKADEAEARAELTRAVRLQGLAEALVLPRPKDAPVAARAAAAALSEDARNTARFASFISARTTLQAILIYAVLLILVLGVSRYLQSVTARTIVAHVALDMQVRLVSHVLTLSAGQLKDMSRGDLISRLTADLARAVNGVIMPAAEMFVLQPLRLVVLLFLAFQLSPELTLGLIVVGLLILAPMRWAGRHIRGGARERQSALAEVLEALHQMFAGIRVVKAFRREAHERQRFRQKTERAYTADVQVIRARVGSRTALRLLNDLTVPLLILGGGWLVIGETANIDAGLFAAFSALIVFMYRPAKELVMAYNSYQDSLPSLVRVVEVFERRPVIVDPPDARLLTGIRESIRAEDVWFSYDGETDVLQGISFEAPVGTTTAFVGHSGSGKSTLMDLIARHLDPTRGRILIDGAPLTELRLGDYLSRVAMVSQAGFLFHDTIRENIRYGRLDATDAEIEAAARSARIHDEILALPGGYGYVVGEMGTKLSGGQIQRLTIARALVRKPEVLLLDEAMSALDTRTEHLVQEALEELTRTCTTFAIAHRLSTVRHADQILVLDGGQVLERGSHEALLAQGGRYAELLAGLRDAPETERSSAGDEPDVPASAGARAGALDGAP